MAGPAARSKHTRISTHALDREFHRADLVFYDLDHSGASYAGHVFLNNPEATVETGRDVESGYAGTFHIFGHGGCFGDLGHCDVHPRRLYDPRPAHPLTPAQKTVIATDALKKAIRAGGEILVTVVPEITGVTAKTGTPTDVCYYAKTRINTYR